MSFIFFLLLAIIIVAFVLPSTLAYILFLTRRHRIQAMMDSALNKIINDASSSKSFTRNYINSHSGNMSQEEALKILGLNPEPNQTEINSAYHNLMKSIHPDKGGSSYLAQKLNEARDKLLNE